MKLAYGFAVSPAAGHPEPSRFSFFRKRQARRLREIHAELEESISAESAHANSTVFIEVASTRESLDAAFALFEKNRVEWGIEKAGPSGGWCPIQLALPESQIIVARLQGQTVGAIAVFRDCAIGLPAVAHFNRQIRALRSERARRIVEMTPACVNLGDLDRPGLADQIVISLTRFAAAQAGSPLMLMRAHPTEAFSYEAILGFERVATGKTKWGTPQACSVWSPPKMGPALSVPPSRLSRELLRFLFEVRTDVFMRASRQALELVHSAYRPHFSLKGIRALENFSPRPYRAPADLPVTIRASGGQSWIGRIFDLSDGGFFLEGETRIPLQTEFEASFRLSPVSELIRVRVRARWVNQEPSGRLPSGVGFQFLERHPEVRGFFPGSLRARARKLHPAVRASN